MNIKGRGDFVLYEKIKNIKLKLKAWNKEVFGWLNLKIEEKVDEHHELDQYLISNVGGYVSGAVEGRKVVADEIWKNLELKECMLRLKSG